MRSFPLLVLVLLSLIQQPAHASDDGKICAGLRMLLCVPLFAAASVVEAVKPMPPDFQLLAAADQGDLAKVKKILARHDDLRNSQAAGRALVQTAGRYLTTTDETEGRRWLDIAEYLLDGGIVDVRGVKGTDLLQATVPGGAPQADEWARRMRVVRLAIAHGASAQGVRLAQCLSCAHEEDFLALMMAHGVDLNLPEGIGTLFDTLVDHDEFAAAERLVRQGADPNGGGVDTNMMLFRIARGCSPKNQVKRDQAKSVEDWQRCVDRVLKRAEFVIAQGADPNGKPSPENGCRSAYVFAVERNNPALAETLLRLGADPEAETQCKRRLSPEALARLERAKQDDCRCAGAGATPRAPASQH